MQRDTNDNKLRFICHGIAVCILLVGNDVHPNKMLILTTIRNVKTKCPPPPPNTHTSLTQSLMYIQSCIFPLKKIGYDQALVILCSLNKYGHSRRLSHQFDRTTLKNLRHELTFGAASLLVSVPPRAADGHSDVLSGRNGSVSPTDQT